MNTPAETPSSSNGYRYYVLVILALTYAFSYMDRQIVSILMGDIKQEFNLSDTQLGLLSGLSFALFYSVLAIPIARYADRAHRINIVSIALTMWSLVTAACALATNFVQLLLCRVGVGVGEAGGLSPSHSVISDYFKASERPLALSIFSLGTLLGGATGLIMGGYVAENYGWRWAFVIAGLPGVALAVILKLTVKEPIRGGMDEQQKETKEQANQAPSATFGETLRELSKNKAYMGAIIGHLLAVFAGYAMSSWLPELMLRNFDVSRTQVGSVIGLTFLAGGASGMLLGGFLATQLSKRNPAWQILVAVVGIGISIPMMLFALSLKSFMGMSITMAIALLFFNWHHGPGLAVVQSYVKPEQRATAASFNFFLANLLGLGLAPLMVGGLSDLLAPTFGVQSINVALGAALAVALPGALVFYKTSKHLK